MQSHPTPAPENEHAGDGLNGIEVLMIGALAGVACFVFLFAWKQGDDDNLSSDEVASIIDGNGDPSRLWPVDHPLASALIVFAVVSILIRLWVFMKRLEDRA